MRSHTKLANTAWESLLTAHTHLLREFAADPVWKQHDLSMREYDVLYTLTKLDRPTRIGELQTGVLLSQPALSRLVDRLVDRGLLTRTTDPVDKRAVRVTLTAPGRSLQQTVGRTHAAAVTVAMNARLTPEELTTLQHLSQKLQSADTPQEPS